MGSFSIRINASAILYCLSPTGFSIRINTSAVLYCVSPTGYCARNLRLTINLLVRYKFIARLNFGRTPMPFVRWGGS